MVFFKTFIRKASVLQSYNFCPLHSSSCIDTLMPLMARYALAAAALLGISYAQNATNTIPVSITANGTMVANPSAFVTAYDFTVDGTCSPSLLRSRQGARMVIKDLEGHGGFDRRMMHDEYFMEITPYIQTY